jgi:carotenoid cleavage dioxygenase-like enzyme
MFNGGVHYSIFNKDRQLTLKNYIPLQSPRMIHDFLITENYIVIPDSPLEFKPDRPFVEGKFVFKFNTAMPSRYGFIKRTSKNPNDVRWFNLPCHMSFHFVNAWEEKNEAGDDIVRLYGCPVPGNDFSLDLTEEHTFLKGPHTANLNRFIFNLTTGDCSMTPLSTDMCVEFPALDWDLIGQKNRYCYLSEFMTELP